ncbi:protein translocase subunit secA [Gracilibacillus ureilyticus]|uniref:Protein translocase subunit SecA n=1 Tax=Gracilibacillus ureilyticus TaxID=531814 RepID=A0A1H9RBL4_9BACI|nr:accessory Sec system translocase SecA2 [Gracilibacillus ureilyticus]SER70080.1 protein translocase subunit secA [Gracilibacillus ureilyticus]
MNLITKWKESQQYKVYKKYQRIVEEINQLEEIYAKLSDSQLKNKTTEFKKYLENGGSIEQIKVEAFATVREASKRVLGLRHYDVQLIGGLVLLEGNIAEMPTGEGKTLVASLPSYLRALEGKGVHVITVNDYLARRDRDLIGQIHSFLGLTVGINVPGMDPNEKVRAYQADITYGIGTEFGFDFLRDNMTYAASQKVQRPYHYAIIDEVDSVLIDEAKTPLIVAGKARLSENLHQVCSKVVKTLKEGKDYQYDLELKTVNFKEDGINKIEKIFAIDNFYDLEHRALNHYMNQALRAKVLFERDVDYIVEDSEIKLVDMNTGRIMDGRSLSEGLHQAIEAKEGLKVTEENKAQASITIQNYYHMYPVIGGMTGTAKTEEAEFQKVYGMDVIPIPTNKPVIREDMKDMIFQTKEQKYNFLVEEVKKRHAKGQPILIGTTSIIQSEIVAKYLDKEKLDYQLLNAKSVEREVHLISLAGQKSQITIATNMAGRGTDIMLGEGVAELGGLHVIGTERHESRRIDNQLKGRSGRQGDPGSSQFIISLEDELVKRFGHDLMERVKDKVTADKNGVVTNKQVNEWIDTIQKISEGQHFQFREFNFQLEQVINEQRKVIYQLRDKILTEEQVVKLISQYAEDVINHLVDRFIDPELLPDQWEQEKLITSLNEVLFVEIPEDTRIEEYDAVEPFIKDLLQQHFEVFAKLNYDTMAEEHVRKGALSVIDRNWTTHLEEMGRLKDGIGMRSYQQEDPIQIYTKEGYQIFEWMYKQTEGQIHQFFVSSFKAIMFKLMKEEEK